MPSHGIKEFHLFNGAIVLNGMGTRTSTGESSLQGFSRLPQMINTEDNISPFVVLLNKLFCRISIVLLIS
jgi:hypothetical protein